jgi:hypothetical protein
MQYNNNEKQFDEDVAKWSLSSIDKCTLQRKNNRAESTRRCAGCGRRWRSGSISKKRRLTAPTGREVMMEKNKNSGLPGAAELMSPQKGNRRDVLRGLTIGVLAAGGAMGPVFGGVVLAGSSSPVLAADKTIKMAFIQFQPHTVSTAWAKGIQEVLTIQPNTEFQLLDGQAKADVQISLMDTVINDGVKVIFVQPVDSVGLAPSPSTPRMSR